MCEREDEISPSVTRGLPPRNEPHSAQMEVLDMDLVERAGSDDVEAAVSDDVEGIDSTDVDGTGSGDVVEVDSYVARGTKSDDVEGTMPETVSDNVDDSLEFSFAM